jgi:hypothetical protein
MHLVCRSADGRAFGGLIGLLKVKKERTCVCHLAPMLPFGGVAFEVDVQPNWFLPPACSLAGGETQKLPAFTIAQPKPNSNFSPLHVQGCTPRDLQHGQADRWRFHPFHYTFEHGLVHTSNGWKVPEVFEREAVLEAVVGLPLDCTLKCLPKSEHKCNPLFHEYTRLSLLRSTRTVMVLSYLMKILCEPRGLCPCLSLAWFNLAGPLGNQAGHQQQALTRPSLCNDCPAWYLVAVVMFC